MDGTQLFYAFLATLLGSIIGTIICVITTPKGEKYDWEIAKGCLYGFLIWWGIMWITYIFITYFLK
ncbi:hypothetical protein P7D15_02355 [Bacillus cereus]|uniref:hypothetical protein n=1 Tax=Bacillus cereus group TaxID=86661 RepID=UPI00119EBCD4|nr:MULTISPECIES: hypothetical protein [Bacillus cereus group]MDF9599261.1 hypothetical protein [Bacillus cereus]MDG1589593.1 hypothetical protein [Bacillus cereus]MDX5808353.1 hypothetical protein [Bacillus cereus group sp. BfR-BA-02730]